MYGIIPQCDPSSAKLRGPVATHTCGTMRAGTGRITYGRVRRDPVPAARAFCTSAASLDQSWIHRTLPRHAEIDPTGGKACRPFVGVTTLGEDYSRSPPSSAVRCEGPRAAQPELRLSCGGMRKRCASCTFQ